MTLHDAIDSDYFKIDNTRYTDTEIQEMSVDDLDTLKMRIMKKISGISASLKEKQIDYADSGKRAPKNWYMNRKLALSINQRVLAYVNSLLRKHRERKAEMVDYFIEHAKVILPSMLFEEILYKAQNSLREGKF